MRKPRSKYNYTEDMLQKPIDITKIGTEDDPCFGVLYEPISEECHACGDSELCAIVKMHKIKNPRGKIAYPMKDEDESTQTTDFMSVVKLKNIIAKMAKKKPIHYKTLNRKLGEKYDPEQLLPPNRIPELTKIAIKEHKNLRKIKRDGKIYIKYK